MQGPSSQEFSRRSESDKSPRSDSSTREGSGSKHGKQEVEMRMALKRKREDEGEPSDDEQVEIIRQQLQARGRSPEGSNPQAGPSTIDKRNREEGPPRKRREFEPRHQEASEMEGTHENPNTDHYSDNQNRSPLRSPSVLDLLADEPVQVIERQQASDNPASEAHLVESQAREALSPYTLAIREALGQVSSRYHSLERIQNRDKRTENRFKQTDQLLSDLTLIDSFALKGKADSHDVKEAMRRLSNYKESNLGYNNKKIQAVVDRINNNPKVKEFLSFDLHTHSSPAGSRLDSEGDAD